MAVSTEYETRALLRAHRATASGYRHLTRHCPICHQLLRLAMEPVTAFRATSPPEPPVPRTGRRSGAQEGREAQDESPSTG
ncbi:DUF6274 family protein [Streptomyces sp. NPDC002785]|uniref:DUF6274 family protein n=1 Tax=Streptomyces sp. NPDC002785 TaxID=3154543 RepID=UPI00331FE085